MRVRLSLIAVVSLLVAAILITGCGASKAPSKPAVSLSILAPTSGATLGVRNIVVAGTVTPASATVTVGGTPVKVVDGVYNVPVQMSQPNETITVAGQADGYQPSSATTTVQYSAALADTIAAGESAGSQSPNTGSSSNSGHAAGGKSAAGTARHVATAAAAAKHASSAAKPAASHSATHASSHSTSHSSTAHKANTHKTTRHRTAGHRTSSHRTSSHRTSSHRTSSHRTSSHRTSSHRTSSHRTSSHKTSGHKTSRHHSSGNRSSSSHTGGGSTSSGTGRQPEQRSALTRKSIKRLWIDGCVKGGTGGSYKPYCRCTYAHLAKAGALSSRKRLNELMRKLKPYERTHDIAKLPAFVRRAINDCISKLPPLEPIVSKPAVSQLPGISHPSAPVNTPTPPSSTPPTTAPAPTTPTTPAPTGTAPTGTEPTGTTPTTGAGTQTSGGTPPPWASLVRELNHVVTAISTHHPLTAAPTDHRSVRKSHRRATERRSAPKGGHERSLGRRHVAHSGSHVGRRVRHDD